MYFLTIFLAIWLWINVEACSNRFEGRTVRASGDWSNLPLWNAEEPFGTMNFDWSKCQYTLSLGGLRPESTYKWKLVVDGSWSLNFGCSGQNGPDCAFSTNSDGQVRLVARVSAPTPQLGYDFAITSIDHTIPFRCVNKFEMKIVRASGNFSRPEWTATEPLGLMEFNKITCEYSVVLTLNKPNLAFEWKVTINNDWKENYGCGDGGGKNCFARTNYQGNVRLIFRPAKLKLTNDYIVISPSSDSPIKTTSKQPVLVNPIKPCESKTCSSCANNQYFKYRLLRVSGDWTRDAGSATLWSPAEPRGLLTFNENFCEYEAVVDGLKSNIEYKWKVSVGNSWLENYGCEGLLAADCTFRTNHLGKIRFIVKPTASQSQSLQMTTDFNVFECGDGVCNHEQGETCSYCPKDCAQC